MAVKVEFDKEFIKKLNLLFYEAFDRTYVNDIVMNTPVDTGITRNSWDFYPTGVLEYELVNTNGPVVMYLEFGTGIYGPRKRYITPVRRKALRWYDRRLKKYVFAKRVSGIEPRKFIEGSFDDSKNFNDFVNIVRRRFKRYFGGGK